MRVVVHDQHGDPAQVLRAGDREDPVEAPPGSAIVRVRLAPVHPGDLHGVSGSPLYGDREEIPGGGRIPGFEGVGTVVALAADVDPRLGLDVGARVAFFPVAGAWADLITAPAHALVVLPDGISDEVGAHLFVNVLTARHVVRAGLAANLEVPAEGDVVLQTGAGSAVGQMITAELLRRNLRPLRLVRSESAARRLVDAFPGPAVVATEAPDWPDRVVEVLAGAPLYLSLDSVGGALLGHLSRLLEPGGAVVSYGSLDGSGADVRSFAPRRLTLVGVSVLSWFAEPEEVRRADLDAALDLASRAPQRFGVSSIHAPSAIADAVGDLGRQGRSGAVLLDFRGDAKWGPPPRWGGAP